MKSILRLLVIVLLHGCVSVCFAQSPDDVQPINKVYYYTWFSHMRYIDSVYQAMYPEVPKGLCQACAWGESNYDTTAIRFEPDYKRKYGKVVRAHAVRWCRMHHHVRSIETEFDQRCTSYQMHQNMGENLREDGFDAPTIGTITTIEDIAMFYKVINRRIQKYKRKHGVHHVTREVFLDAMADYNGGPGAVISRGHYRNWAYVSDKERRLIQISGPQKW